MRLTDANTVVVETLDDVKQVLKEFVSKDQNIPPEITTQIQAEGKTYKVSAPTACSYSELLADGFTIVKKRMEAINKPRELELGIEPVNVDGHMWLDDLIMRRLGGVRDGLAVKWELDEGTFRFDPFSGKLTQC